MKMLIICLLIVFCAVLHIADSALYIEVPIPHQSFFGKSIKYQSTTTATFKNLMAGLNYSCVIGHYSSDSKDDFQACIPTISGPIKWYSWEIDPVCRTMSAEYTVYLNDDNKLVWCDKGEGKQQSKTKGVISIPKHLQRIYMNTLEFESQDNASYELPLFGPLYSCMVGYHNAEKNFQVCKPKVFSTMFNKDQNIVRSHCSKLAAEFTVYLKGSKIVWCGKPKLR